MVWPRFALLALLVSTALSPVPLFAADGPAELRANLNEKLAKKFVKAGGWVLDYDQAQKRAREEKKPIFIYFTRTFAP